MRIIEEKRLKDIINKYQLKSNNIISFYNNCNDIKVESLQNIVSKKTNKFFDEISFVLDAVIAIIKKPYIANKSEDVVLRSEIAGSVSNDALRQTFKEPAFWKEKSSEMIPEYVHQIQYEDDIKTYENIFIGMLIDLISGEVDSFLEMFESLVPSIIENTEINENKKIKGTIKKAKALNKKLRYIKETYFYKEVSKNHLDNRFIMQTNVLTKNRLYNYCYKFYKQFIRYTDNDSLLADLKKYYLILMLKCLNGQGFVLEEKTADVCDLFLYKDDFKVNINTTANYIKYLVEYKKHTSATNIYIDINDENTEHKLNGDYNYFLDVYNIKNLDNNQFVFLNTKKESELINYIVCESLKTYKGKKLVYSTYCPVCKSKDIRENKDLYICNSCESEYLFSGKSTIWFKKMRRV